MGFPVHRRPWLLSAGLAILVLAVFRSALDNGFVGFDDPSYVTRNPSVLAGLSWRGLVWSLTSFHASNWHPLTWLSHMLDVTFYGVDPRGHHLGNVLLHALTAVGLFGVLRGMTGTIWPGTLVAALFAVHPLRVESVAWISERKDVLSGALFMATLLAYLGYVRRPGRRRYAILFLCFLLGLMAKPMLVTLPVILLVLDWWPLGRLRRLPSSDGSGPDGRILHGLGPAGRRCLAEKIPLLGLSVASAVVTLAAQHSGEAMGLMEVLPLHVRLGNAAVAAVGYLGKTFCPVNLSVLYPHPGADLSWMRVALAVAVLVTVSLLALRWRQFPWIAAGWAWYLVMLLPVSGLIQVGSQAMADRYTYLPQIGILVVLAWSVAGLLKRLGWARAMSVFLVIPLVVLIPLTHRQIHVWRDFDTLLAQAVTSYRQAMRPFRAAVANAPEKAEAHNDRGRRLAEAGDLVGAAEAFRQSLALQPAGLEARYNLGKVYDVMGYFGEAMREYEAILAIDPRHAPALNNLGVDLGILGRHDEAIALFRRALEIDPSLAEARFNLNKTVGLKIEGGRHQSTEPAGAGSAGR